MLYLRLLGPLYNSISSPSATAAGDPREGRIDSVRRRVSFFGPSPAANPVGVGEGHRILSGCPFFLAVPQGASRRYFVPKRRRQAVDNWIEAYQLGRLASEERLEGAAQHRRLVRSTHFGRLPLIVKSLLLLFM